MYIYTNFQVTSLDQNGMPRFISFWPDEFTILFLWVVLCFFVSILWTDLGLLTISQGCYYEDIFPFFIMGHFSTIYLWLQRKF